jgi:hypothetical protein
MINAVALRLAYLTLVRVLSCGYLDDLPPTEYEQRFYAAHRDDQSAVGKPLSTVKCLASQVATRSELA